MNLSDFSREFDLRYNNSLSFAAPPINVYEKSLYLTQAQEEIVKDSCANYEKDENSREKIRNLVVNYNVVYDADLNSALSALKFNNNSKLVEVPAEAWYIVSEHINADIPVKPTPIDEFNRNIKNPFKKPVSEEVAWRLDISDSVSATPKNIREIVYPSTIASYTMRYVKKPTPIILESIAAYGVTIEGLDAATNCTLSSEVHRSIVKRAVELAILTYEEKTLKNSIQAG